MSIYKKSAFLHVVLLVLNSLLVGHAIRNENWFSIPFGLLMICYTAYFAIHFTVLEARGKS